jgi:hypothetical protein
MSTTGPSRASESSTELALTTAEPHSPRVEREGRRRTRPSPHTVRCRATGFTTSVGGTEWFEVHQHFGRDGGQPGGG